MTARSAAQKPLHTSLFWALAMGATTTVHHAHAAIALGDVFAWHVVATEAVLIPLTLASFLVFRRTGSRPALALYLLIALAGFVGLALYEGGWNHTAKIVAHLRIDRLDIATVLPPGAPHVWFYELTGVATLVVALVASLAAWRLFLAVRGR